MLHVGNITYTHLGRIRIEQLKNESFYSVGLNLLWIVLQEYCMSMMKIFFCVFVFVSFGMSVMAFTNLLHSQMCEKKNRMLKRHKR